MRHVLTLGVEGRLLPQKTVEIDGEEVEIPAHWAAITICGGVDEHSAVRMWQAEVSVAGSDSLQDLRKVLNEALGHFPVDGGYALVEEGKLLSRTSQLLFRRREYRLWSPQKTAPTGVVEGAGVVGFGIGLEHQGEHCVLQVPYFAVLLYEEMTDGTVRPRVVPAREFAPRDPATRIVKSDPPLDEMVRDFAEAQKHRARPGDVATIEVCQSPAWYRLLDVQRLIPEKPKPPSLLEKAHGLNTSMGAAFASAIEARA